MARIFGGLLQSLLLALLGCGATSHVVELDRGPVDPLAAADAKATVLLFVRTDCPISNRYAPEITRLVGAWRSEGVVFWLVYVDPGPSGPEGDAAVSASVRAHVRDWKLPARVLLDRRHELVAAVGATITPEAAVFTPQRRIVYRGRIDDRFADLGVARAQPTTHELEEALAAVVAGRMPAVTETTAIGCVIEGVR